MKFLFFLSTILVLQYITGRDIFMPVIRFKGLLKFCTVVSSPVDINFNRIWLSCVVDVCIGK